MEKVTVVIPNYNGIKYLNDCLEALYVQSAECGFRVIVVDNGSTDGSAEQAKEKFLQVKWICLPENTGFCHAVNEGIKASQTDYVLLLNNDTKVYEGFVQNLYEAIEKDKRIFSVSAKMLQWDNPTLVDDAGDRYCVLGWGYARGKGKSAADYDKSVNVFSACGGAAIYRKSVFEEIGCFDELHFAYMEDMDIGYRARIYGYRNIYEPAAQVLHFGSASSGSRYNAFKAQLAAVNNVYVIGKNMPLLQWIWNLPFLLLGFLVKFLFFCKKRMGGLYAKGVWNGLKRCFSKEGRAHKVHFRFKNLKHYLRIQGGLYLDLFRMFIKS
ncbi:MAG: glycosyltransferase family 2 protein [Lachnospiraceae bacterium]|nr:glycosyltransferase family 2 protein [Lachnospiraceae bacterium]